MYRQLLEKLRELCPLMSDQALASSLLGLSRLKITWNRCAAPWVIWVGERGGGSSPQFEVMIATLSLIRNHLSLSYPLHAILAHHVVKLILVDTVVVRYA